jgi:hypothetical protein
MATKSHISTIAFSVHESIVIFNKAMCVDELVAFLAEEHDPRIVAADVQAAIEAAIARGLLRELATTPTTFDTVGRDPRGKRISASERNYSDKNSPDDGWFTVPTSAPRKGGCVIRLTTGRLA